MMNRTRLFKFEPDVQTIFVVGDLHGDFESYEAVIEAWRKEENAHIVFLGDYADRGQEGVEILESLTQLVENKRVVALKGNHEDFSAEGQPLFFPCTLMREVKYKRGDWNSYFHDKLQPFYQSLYLAALVPEKILFVHGGISNKITGIESLRQPSVEIERDILWSDPAENPGQYPDERGAGVAFGPDITDKVMESLGVKQIIRSHQPALASSSPYYSQGGKVITISSTSVYGGKPFYLRIDIAAGNEIKVVPL